MAIQRALKPLRRVKMKLLMKASLMAALAASVIPASSVTAGPRWYREVVYYGPRPAAPISPHQPPTTSRDIVGWDRYYCDGTVRSYGNVTGDFEQYEYGDCT